MTIVLKSNRRSRDERSKKRSWDTGWNRVTETHILNFEHDFKAGTELNFTESTGSFVCEEGWLSDTPYHWFLQRYSKIPTPLASDLREDSEDTSVRLDGVRCHKKIKNPSAWYLHCLRDCNLQPANGPAAFVTSQQGNRPVSTEHFLENSCPWNLILMLKTLHPRFL